MKFSAAATIVLAGVARAAVADQALNQDLALNLAGAGDMNALSLATALYNNIPMQDPSASQDQDQNQDQNQDQSQQSQSQSQPQAQGQQQYGGGKGGKPDFQTLVKKVSCALPCVEKGASKVPCKGKNLVESACNSIDDIRKNSEQCVYKCGIDKNIVDIVTRGFHYLCSKRSGAQPGNGYNKKPSKKPYKKPSKKPSKKQY